MVTSLILSRYSKGGAPGPGASRRINGGPIYPHAEVLNLLSQEVEVRPVTRTCIDDVQNLNLNNAGLVSLLTRAVTHGQYLNAQWCETGKPGVWAACDAYKVSRSEQGQHAEQELELPLYVKFCIGKKGVIMLLISCHHSDHWEDL